MTAESQTGSGVMSEAAGPATREVAAAALLAAFAGTAAFIGLASNALFSSMANGGAGGLESLARVIQAPSRIPLLTVVAGAAVVGLYRQRAWGRRLALLVAALLLVAPAAPPLGDAAAPVFGTWNEEGEYLDRGVIDALLFHVFVLPAYQPGFAALDVLVGGLVALGLLVRPRSGDTARSVTGMVRRPTLAMLLLIVFGTLSLAPYLAWLADLVPSVSANGAPTYGTDAPDLGAGILWALTSMVAAAAGLIAARAIRSRSAIGPYVAPIASILVGVWSAWWLGVSGIRALAPFDGEHGASSGSIVVGFSLVALALIAISTPPIVTVSVFRRRSWFRVAEAAAHRRSSPGLGRFERLTGAGAAVLVAPLVVIGASWIVDPPLPRLGPSQVVLAGVAYDYAAPLDLDGVPITSAGSLDRWSDNLEILDPTVYTILGRGEDGAIVVRAAAGAGWTHDLFVSGDRSSAVVSALCDLVPIERPGVFVDPCGPPRTVRLDGTDYASVTDGDFAIGEVDLVPTGVDVQPAVPADPRVALAVLSIRMVPTSTAFALRIGARIVLYRPVEAYGSAGALCSYSPSAVANPLGDEKFGGTTPPQGCTFPHSISYGGITYLHKNLEHLLLVPMTAITPLGPAEALAPDKATGNYVPEPFPPTIDSTAYRIAGVDPADAIAFVVGDLVLVTASLASQENAEGNVVATELCKFLRPDLEPELWPAGCPR